MKTTTSMSGNEQWELLNQARKFAQENDGPIGQRMAVLLTDDQATCYIDSHGVPTISFRNENGFTTIWSLDP